LLKPKNAVRPMWYAALSPKSQLLRNGILGNWPRLPWWEFPHSEKRTSRDLAH
jgi:hypothetical protein